MIADLADALLSLAFPLSCKICGSEVEHSATGSACDECWKNTRIFTGKETLCTKCGAFFAPEDVPIPLSCPHCEGHHYDKAFAVGIYEKGIAADVIALKSVPKIASRMKASIAMALSRHDLASIDLIIPIPLSKQREIERGYNQAAVIARHIGRPLGKPVDTASLARVSHTPMHRAGMDNRARELSVAGAFRVLRPKLIVGRAILLVDDVFTSGATSSECAKALKKAGASTVSVFTIARAVMGRAS